MSARLLFVVHGAKTVGYVPTIQADGTIAWAAGGGGGGGTPGSQWYSGAGAPAVGLGINGDLYLRTSTGDVYQKAGGAWGAPIENLTGPQGAQGIQGIQGAQGPQGTQGPQGAAGTNGTNGATWRSGTTVPSNALGVDGDYYLRTTTGDVYLRTAGAYAITANITGPQGAQGIQGIQGVQGPTGANGLTVITFSRTGTLTVTAGAGRFYVPAAMTIVGVALAVGTAPTGAAILCDVNQNGTTVFTTQANRPSIAAGASKSAALAVPDVTALAAGDLLSVDVDQIGSTVAGADLTATIRLA